MVQAAGALAVSLSGINPVRLYLRMLPGMKCLDRVARRLRIGPDGLCRLACATGQVISGTA